VIEPGINAKDERNADSLWSCTIKICDEYIANRKKIAELYRQKLTDIDGVRILYDIDGISHSYNYFPNFDRCSGLWRTRDDYMKD